MDALLEPSPRKSLKHSEAGCILFFVDRRSAAIDARVRLGSAQRRPLRVRLAGQLDRLRPAMAQLRISQPWTLSTTAIPT